MEAVAEVVGRREREGREGRVGGRRYTRTHRGNDPNEGTPRQEVRHAVVSKKIHTHVAQ